MSDITTHKYIRLDKLFGWLYYLKNTNELVYIYLLLMFVSILVCTMYLSNEPKDLDMIQRMSFGYHTNRRKREQT